VVSEISKRVCRYLSQSVCPYNIKFAQALKEPAFAPREVLSGKDARTLARELLVMTQEKFSASFRGSPMKRAKLRGLRRNAAVVLGNIGTPEDVDVLTRALDDPEPLMREHAAWALARLQDEAEKATSPHASGIARP
jgi:epoxyqueuosine reductase